MTPIRFSRLGIFTFCLIAVALSGCFGTSPPSHFYALSSLRGPEPIPHTTSTGLGTIVAVGPLSIPDYLNRPEIITRSGRNEMRVNEFQRWAGALDGNLLRTVIDDLSMLLPPDRFSVIQWLPSVQGDVPITYRVMVDIVRFDATPGGTVFLEADWTIRGKDKAIALAKKSSISGTAGGAEFTDLVAAMSKAVEDLSREIAAGMTSLDQKTAGK
ncbi:MAG TPA: PqiC family protein [Nitrospirota bacterium]|nr:PqiC family protein [Nitrospirota bacterium]